MCVAKRRADAPSKHSAQFPTACRRRAKPAGPAGDPSPNARIGVAYVNDSAACPRTDARTYACVCAAEHFRMLCGKPICLNANRQMPDTISSDHLRLPPKGAHSAHTHTHTHFITVPVDKQFRMQIHLCSPDARDVCVRTHVAKTIQFNDYRIAPRGQRAARTTGVRNGAHLQRQT